MGREGPGRPVEVVLDEGPVAADGAGAGAGAGPAGGGGRGTTARVRRRRSSVAAVAVALVAVTGLGLVDARADRRERAALEAAADVPGVLGSLAEPLEEVWHLPVFPPLATAGGVVVTADEPDVVGLDLGTGEPRWRLTRPVGSPRPGCPWSAAGGRDLTRVLCFGLGPQGAAGGGGLTALDPTAGEVRGEVGGDVGADLPLLTFGPAADGDVVALAGTRSGLLATLHDVEAGRERWRVPVDRGDAGFGDVRVSADEQVVVIENSTTVVLDARDGREIGRWTEVSGGVSRAAVRVVSHPGGGFGVWESRFAGRWYAVDGTPGPALEGEPVEPEIDDGASPGVVLLRGADGGRLRAVAVATGRELWDRPAPGRVLLRLGQRLVVSGDDRIEGWDATTGEVVWSVRLAADEDPRGEPYTDGVRLVVPAEDADGLRLTALRIEDGERVWQAPLPAGSEYVAVLGDRLAAVGRFDGRVESARVLG